VLIRSPDPGRQGLAHEERTLLRVQTRERFCASSGWCFGECQFAGLHGVGMTFSEQGEHLLLLNGERGIGRVLGEGDRPVIWGRNKFGRLVTGQKGLVGS
jgi:hypothetical protein